MHRSTPLNPNRAQLINFHITVAAFFLPFALMFLVTGGLYTLAFKGETKTRKETIQLAAPLKPDLAELQALTLASLKGLGVPAPNGPASIRQTGDTFQFDWGGAARDLTLKPTNNPAEASLEIREASWYRRFVNLHKAKGNAFSKAISITWCVGLLLMFLSGLAMAAASPKHLRLSMISAGAGFVVFVAYYLLG